MNSKRTWPALCICLALAAMTLAVYAPAFHFSFLNYQDPVYVTENPHVNAGFQWANLGWYFQAGYAGNWHPLTWISHAVDCSVFGSSATGPHVENVLLHMANTILLFLLLFDMTAALWRSATVAALFALHPLHVESVAWISERKDVLSSFFFLLTLLAYVRYTGRPPRRRPNTAQGGIRWDAEAVSATDDASNATPPAGTELKSVASDNPPPSAPQSSPRQTVGDVEPERSGRGGSRPAYILALFLFALGLMAKPMVVTLPCILLLLDFWPLDRFAGEREAFVPGRLVRLLVEKTPFFALSIASSVMTVMAQEQGSVFTHAAHIPFKARFINAETSYWRYLKHIFWPTDLGPSYPYVFHAPKVTLIVIGLFLAGVTWGAWRTWKTRPYWIVGWLWFVVMLVPVIDLFHSGGEPIADRYMYLPIIGLFIVACWDACDLAARWPRSQIALGCVGAVVVTACLVTSSRQLQFWRDEGTIVARVAEPESNFLGHANYAAYLMHHGELDKAEAECRAAMRIAPENPLPPALLGEILRKEGKLAEAEKTLRALLDSDPQMVAAHLPLGQILLAEGKPDEAAGHFDLVLQSNPNDADAHWGRGSALLASKDTGGAIKEYVAALKVRPNFPSALNDLAWILATDHRPEFHNPATAVKMAERACSLTDDKTPQIVGTLAAAYAANGDFDQAVATAQKARDIAAAQGMTNIAEANLQLLELYKTHRAYTE